MTKFHLRLVEDYSKFNIHEEIFNSFVRYRKPNIECKLEKNPVVDKSENFQFYRVVLLTRDTVYKIHSNSYQKFQKELVKNLRKFFIHYQQPLDFFDYYRYNVCWIEWKRIPGKNLGVQDFGLDVWVRYLEQAKFWWRLHLRASEKMGIDLDYMWWHDDMTAWNVIEGIDGKYHLVDWDDFKLISIKEAKEKMIAQNLEYVKLMNKDSKLIAEFLSQLMTRFEDL